MKGGESVQLACQNVLFLSVIVQISPVTWLQRYLMKLDKGQEALPPWGEEQFVPVSELLGVL